MICYGPLVKFTKASFYCCLNLIKSVQAVLESGVIGNTVGESNSGLEILVGFEIFTGIMPQDIITVE